jgi:hypothetical protein
MARNDKGIEIEAEHKKEINIPSSATMQGAGVVRFWSTLKEHKVAISPGKNAAFHGHVLVLDSGSPEAKVMHATRSPYIKEVLDVPFGTEEELGRFNKYLQKLAYNSESGMTSKRGKTAILGLFNSSDGDVASLGIDAIIMKALKNKSFKEGI